MKNLKQPGGAAPVLKDHHHHNGKKKHERLRKPAAFQNETEDNSSEDLLDDYDEEVSNVYRKISERRSELSRARSNGDDCHVS